MRQFSLLLSIAALLLSSLCLLVGAFSVSKLSAATNSPRTLATSSRQRCVLHYGTSDFFFSDSDDDDDDDYDDDDDMIDPDSLGDWRAFRRNLASTMDGSATAAEASTTTTTSTTNKSGGDQQGSGNPFSGKSARTVRAISQENQELLLSQNEKLGKEFRDDVWAHETSTPEIGGLLIRLPLEAELHRNYRHSIIGRKLKKLIGDEQNIDVATWYARAQRLVEDEMQNIADMADDEGQIDATTLDDECAEMLTLYLDNQEEWQEVCLLLSNDSSTGDATSLVINRPMAMKLTENLAKLVLNGVFQTSSSQFMSKGGITKFTQETSDMTNGARADLMKFMSAFGNDCAVYVGGPDHQDQAAIMIHGIPDLPGAVEISPGSRIYRGGLEAAIDGVLDGKYNPLEFRFFIGCHEYDEHSLDVAVHLGKYQPIACARSVALKQCISLPKPLWHEVMELCGGELADLSQLELLKRDDLKFQVLDDDDYGLDDIPNELSELDNFDDEDDYY